MQDFKLALLCTKYITNLYENLRPPLLFTNIKLKTAHVFPLIYINKHVSEFTTI